MSGAAGLHILLVEDEALIAMMAEDMLDSIGCASVSIATTIAEALALIAQKRFDVALLDVNLNGERSMAVADAAAAAGLPYIFTTGYGAGGMASPHAAAPVLAKPYGMADLEMMLARCAADRVSPLA
jgi:CheY-like chemotaxis protein